MKHELTLDELVDKLPARVGVEVYDDFDDFKERDDLLFCISSSFNAEVYLKSEYANARVCLLDVVSEDRIKCLISAVEEPEKEEPR